MKSPWHRVIGSCLLLLAMASFPAADEGESGGKPAAGVKLDPFGDPLADDADSLLVDRQTERKNVDRLFAASDDPAAALAALKELKAKPSELELRALRNVDRALGGSRDAEHAELVRLTLEKMALTGDAETLLYLHKVFDTQPARRAEVATAIAKLALAGTRRPHDWPLLVRSLTVIAGDDTIHIVKALRQFTHQRATSPTVQRNALLVGLREGGATAEEVVLLLNHWLQRECDDINAWSEEYHRLYPHLPPATLPRDEADSRHRFADLAKTLEQADTANANLKHGAELFTQATCVKCHRVKDQGEKIGPELTKVMQRFTRREIVESILFPSQQIFDQYVTRRLVLRDGTQVSGLVGEAGPNWNVLLSTGEKKQIPKTDVEEILDSPLSTMPNGLWEKFTAEDLVDLVAFLEESAE